MFYGQQLILKCMRPPKSHSGSDILEYQFARNKHNTFMKLKKVFLNEY